MDSILDLGRYPLDQPDSAAWRDLVERCRGMLQRDGLFNLPGFLREDARARLIRTLTPLFASVAFTHARSHNIYFDPPDADLPADHPARHMLTTVNHTLCADQLAATDLARLYAWPPFAAFLSAVMQRPGLFPMADPLARVNAMAYNDGEALNWHFDRSEFTTTLLLQAPQSGGAFEYAKDLRSDGNPNHDAITALLAGQLRPTRMALDPGTLNVFRGRDTAHRVTPAGGPTPRIIAVFSYFDRPGVTFSPSERSGFYGRSA